MHAIDGVTSSLFINVSIEDNWLKKLISDDIWAPFTNRDYLNRYQD